MAVKLAASISVSRSAARQSSELLAKASMAKTVRSRTRRLGFIGRGRATPVARLRCKDDRATGVARPQRSIAQPIELHRVVARDLAARLGADARKLAVEELLRIRPDAVRMG